MWVKEIGSEPEILINEENFPDKNFRDYLLAQSYGSDGYLTNSEIKYVTWIDVNEKEIRSLKGIELFTALNILFCHKNQLTALDVSKNTALTGLYCDDNNLSALEISKNTALTSLSCQRNQLTALDVSKNTVLTGLYCNNNQLTALDVSKNTALTSLQCLFNQLNTLDVSKNTALTYLNCSYNNLLALDISKNTALTTLYCQYNKLTALDVSKNTALTSFQCNNNQLTALDVSKNTALTSFQCNNNQLTALDISKYSALTTLYCQHNQLTSLDVSKNTALTGLYCFDNKLNVLDVSMNIALKTLSCSRNQLKSLDLSNNKQLTALYCAGLQITGAEMDKLIQSLPSLTEGTGKLHILYNDSEEGNVCTKKQVDAAKAKGWIPKTGPREGKDSEWVNYEPTDFITITVTSVSREYGKDNPKFEYTVEGGTLDGTPTISCTATAKSDVGTYDITIAKGTVKNNNVTLVGGKLTVTKAPLTISGGTYTMKQGEALPTFMATYSGFKNGETEDVLTKKPTLTTTATSASAPGTYEVTISGAEAKNYDIKYVKGTLTITEAAPITVTVKSISREYGDPNPTFEYTVQGGTLNGTPEISCATTAKSDVGTYDITIAKGTVKNNNVTFVGGKLTVTKAQLTISGGTYSMKQGDTLPTFIATYSGFKNGETSAVLTKQPTLTTTATSSSAPGSYYVTISGAEAKNYAITYQKGTLIIEPKPNVLGDVDGDGEVKPYDLVELADVILKRVPETSAAEIDGLEGIDVGDYVELVKILLSPSKARQTTSIIAANVDMSATLQLEPFAIGAGGTREMVISLNNPDTELTAVQFDLVLPPGLSLKKNAYGFLYDMGCRTSWDHHQLDANETAGKIRFMLASSSNKIIDGIEGAIVRITVVADERFEGGTIILQDVVGVSLESGKMYMPAHSYELLAGSTNGVYQICEDKANATVYNLSGQRLTGLKKGINIIGGKKVINK